MSVTDDRSSEYLPQPFWKPNRSVPVAERRPRLAPKSENACARLVNVPVGCDPSV